MQEQLLLLAQLVDEKTLCEILLEQKFRSDTPIIFNILLNRRVMCYLFCEYGPWSTVCCNNVRLLIV